MHSGGDTLAMCRVATYEIVVTMIAKTPLFIQPATVVAYRAVLTVEPGYGPVEQCLRHGCGWMDHVNSMCPTPCNWRRSTGALKTGCNC